MTASPVLLLAFVIHDLIDKTQLRVRVEDGAVIVEPRAG